MSGHRTPRWLALADPFTVGTVAIAALCVAAALRTIALDATGFSVDEAYNAWAASDPDRLRDALAVDHHPAAWYVLLLAWERAIGAGDVALRLLSSLAGLIFVAACALAAGLSAGRSAALWALVFASIWPMAVEGQRELRMYSWLAALSACALLASVWAMRRPGAGRWILVGVAAALPATVHYFGTFATAAILSGLALGQHRRGAAIATVVSVAVLVPFAPALASVVGRHVVPGEAPIGPSAALFLWDTLTVGTFADPATAFIAAIAFVPAVAIGLGRGRDVILLAAALVGAAGLPLVITAIAVRYPYPLAHEWWSAALGPLVVATARGVSASGRWRRPYGILLTILLCAGLLSTAVAARDRADWRRVASSIRERERVAREVLVVPAFDEIPLRRYYSGPLPMRGFPAAFDLRPWPGRPAAVDAPAPSAEQLRALETSDEPRILVIGERDVRVLVVGPSAGR